MSLALIIFAMTALYARERYLRVASDLLERQLRTLEKTAESMSRQLTAAMPSVYAVEYDEHLTPEEKLAQVNSIVQPIVDACYAAFQSEGADAHTLGLGYYSRAIGRNVAVSHPIAHLMGIELPPEHRSSDMYSGGSPVQREISNVMRGHSVRYARLFSWNGEVVGHLFANFPYQVYRQGVMATLPSIIGLSLAVMAAAALMCYYILRQIGGAVRVFELAMDDFATNPSAAFEARGTHALPMEFSPLYDHFREMVSRVKALVQELLVSTRLAALGDAVSAVVHDLRNPMTVIQLSSELGLRTTDPERRGEYFRSQLDALKMMSDFIARLLILAKNPNGRREMVRVDGIVADVAMIFEPVSAKAGISFSVETVDWVGSVYGDRVALTQGLMNIVRNAFEATSAGGAIRIKGAAEGSGITISVTDSGSGIPDEYKAQVFERFFTTKGDKGTGIGLALAHSVVVAHAGKIWFESKVGEGTTFHIWLPIAHKDAQLPDRIAS
jgi:signal transduction histidine kinase